MPESTATHHTVERERAIAFGQALLILLQWQEYYVPLTGTYLLPQFYERLRAQDGYGIQIMTLRAYLRGEAFPSEGKVRLIADALEQPRGLLLFLAGYLKSEDMADYPGPYVTLEALEGDIYEIQHMDLSLEAQTRILASLHNTARILRLLHADHAPEDWLVEENERELVIDQLNELWDTPAPPPLELTAAEENALLVRAEAETPRLATMTTPNPAATVPTTNADPDQHEPMRTPIVQNAINLAPTASAHAEQSIMPSTVAQMGDINTSLR